MSSEKAAFNEHLDSLHKLTSIYNYMNQNAQLMDLDSLLRAEYVLIVSAFDNYLHQIVRRKIIERFFNNGQLSSELCIPVDIFQSMHNESDIALKKDLFGAALRKTTEKDSYQSPRSVEYALGLIGVNKIWSKVSNNLGETPEQIKMQLSLIVKRRNQIAHEADIEPSTSSARGIDEPTISVCRDFLKKLVEGIDNQMR